MKPGDQASYPAIQDGTIDLQNTRRTDFHGLQSAFRIDTCPVGEVLPGSSHATHSFDGEPKA